MAASTTRGINLNARKYRPNDPRKAFDTLLTSSIQDALLVSSYIRELRRVGLWPLDAQKHKLANVIEAFNKFEDRDISLELGFSIFPKPPHCRACVLDTRTKVANLMGKVLEGCTGLCLDCIKLGNDEVECRIKHDR
jgi:hypothetical protein